MTDKRRLALMRSAKTSAENPNGMGGREKNPWRKPKPVSLPKINMPSDDADAEAFTTAQGPLTPSEREAT